MGQESVYCEVCRSRVSGAQAVRAGGRTLCPACAPKAAPAAPSRPPSDSSARRARVASPPPASKRLALWIALALAALAFIVIVVLATRPR